MDVPPLVRERLDGESVRSRVDLGGDDAVFVTPTRTLVYRADGLLSDESVSSYPHDVERLDLSVGRRKATFALTYVDTGGKFTVPADRADAVLEPLFGGVLAAADVTDPDEQIREVYRFSELTLALTDGHLVKHVGGVLWDDDYELFPLSAVTGLGAEEGNVATQLVVELDGRPNRVKVPSERAELVRRAIESAVFEYHDVDSLQALREAQGVEDEPAPDSAGAFEEAEISPLVDDGGGDDRDAETDAADDGPVDRVASTDADEGAGATDAVDDSTDAVADDSTDAADDPASVSAATVNPGVEGSPDDDLAELLDRLDALEDAVERQNELVERQQRTIQTLVDELRRGR